MKVLLDEDGPHLLRNELPEHEVVTVAYAGWAGVRNGTLIGLATDAGFEVFLTCDRNLPHQQNIPALGLTVIVLAVPDTRMQSIRPLVADLRATLAANPQPGTLTVTGTWRVT